MVASLALPLTPSQHTASPSPCYRVLVGLNGCALCSNHSASSLAADIGSCRGSTAQYQACDELIALALELGEPMLNAQCLMATIYPLSYAAMLTRMGTVLLFLVRFLSVLTI